MLLMKEGTDTIREILKTLHWPPGPPIQGHRAIRKGGEIQSLGSFPVNFGG